MDKATLLFIEKANKIHNNFYDYSKVKYINNRTKIIITCRIHGDFLQIPSNHLSRKSGCPYCARYKRITKNTIPFEKILDRFFSVHGDRYDYTQVVYKNTKTKIKVLCKTHGAFWITPEKHIGGNGCKLCGIETTKQKLTMPADIVLQRCLEIHGNDYDYSLTDFSSRTDKITIVCKKHGEFKQSLNDHLSGCGCPTCAQEQKMLTTEQFVEKAKRIHGNTYDYSKVEYMKLTIPVKIICPVHGEFLQKPQLHLQGSGCTRCTQKGFSKKSIIWLSNLEKMYNIQIQHVGNGKEYVIPGTKFRVDGFCESTNTIYEFYGDAWHGNPKKFPPNCFCHPKDKTITAGQLYERTKNREEIIKNLGYNVVTIWESDFDNLKQNEQD